MKIITLLLLSVFALAGCVQKQVVPNNPDYAPIATPKLVQAQPLGGSIYNAATSMDLYGDGRAHRIGDILTVSLQESTSSQKSATTEVDKSSSVSMTQPTVLGKAVDILGNPLSFSASGPTSAFDGEGSSDMSNNLTGNITVTVHDVLPNGVLVVRGEKWLTLNQGDEYIRISGLIRPQDIGADNTVVSTKIADARIAYSGTGVVQDSNVMGWASKFFISALMPF
ncbi:MAG: flagellar basal body L-ring protein FlgH [Neptuniibacter sp.]